ncbi:MULTISPECIES: LacI family DNA-binding transcriptional regulator [unclassified Rhodococcus (in: high G+C Gram-positive bacteria)]|jgi:DNA-binding LacI/PurR family transcriptional regulator|uniref:LacI family DNA-binding transcriptional regulator n=2 Tax=Rhodococcus TaxID=1827 RepID=UPI0004842BE0|nr:MULTISPECIES: LacI family DNA-binding transcriptional regulator [unclassified Rhodococcus (in: high G+C Gram-positive bacteria)]KQU31149.1 LacI family transcriptional regulator [Rhodococcus sp. Leaf225]KQU41401.1 LacI family transcriptional regulator [Rhodococcus sp. Leaf258]MDQ1202185.1 DNA-binding LacI/PurR family transcriptional regulator [Rhodococcus sp. SORGH_AS_0303]
MTTTTGTDGRPPVMADVARLAGVSHQTVSRVINGQNNLRPETRERVQRAIDQLGYRPNRAARALVTKRSATIGIIGSKLGFWGPSTTHRTVQSAAREAGFSVSAVSLTTLSRDELVDAMHHLHDQGVEGIVLIAATDDAVAAARSEEAVVPVVVVEGDPLTSRWTVGIDQVGGARLATRHLVDSGHRRIAHLAGPLGWAEARAREQGWREVLDEAGLPWTPPLRGDWSARSGFERGSRLAADPDVTAVFCANDQMALGLLRAFHEHGRRVPEDVSVVGFDDIPEAAYLIPPLTTIRQNFTEVGRRAIEILRAAIDGTGGPETQIAPELVVRASTTRATGEQP